jgi:hypothetical protein
LKSITAKRANMMLALTGRPFWQEETYDQELRDEGEFERIRIYIEENPVRAGLVRQGIDDAWSSAARATRGSARRCVLGTHNSIQAATLDKAYG